MNRRLAELLPLAERAYVRLEAQDLLQRCLKEDNPAPLRELIDEQLGQQNPDLNLLRYLMADVHSRWVVLHERLFDTRRQVISVFREVYGIDLNRFAPSQMLDQFHTLSTEGLFEWLSTAGHQLPGDEALLLREVFAEAVTLARELVEDLRMLESLNEYLDDWIAGLTVLVARTMPRGSATAETIWTRLL